jgi:hypothetical protein
MSTGCQIEVNGTNIIYDKKPNNKQFNDRTLQLRTNHVIEGKKSKVKNKK